jgi:hypothetical protein
MIVRLYRLSVVFMVLIVNCLIIEKGPCCSSFSGSLLRPCRSLSKLTVTVNCALQVAHEHMHTRTLTHTLSLSLSL